jgi:hypothetical protein
MIPSEFFAPPKSAASAAAGDGDDGSDASGGGPGDDGDAGASGGSALVCTRIISGYMYHTASLHMLPPGASLQPPQFNGPGDSDAAGDYADGAGGHDPLAVVAPLSPGSQARARRRAQALLLASLIQAKASGCDVFTALNVGAHYGRYSWDRHAPSQRQVARVRAALRRRADRAADRAVRRAEAAAIAAAAGESTEDEGDCFLDLDDNDGDDGDGGLGAHGAFSALGGAGDSPGIEDPDQSRSSSAAAGAGVNRGWNPSRASAGGSGAATPQLLEGDALARALRRTRASGAGGSTLAPPLQSHTRRQRSVQGSPRSGTPWWQLSAEHDLDGPGAVPIAVNTPVAAPAPRAPTAAQLLRDVLRPSPSPSASVAAPAAPAPASALGAIGSADEAAVRDAAAAAQSEADSEDENKGLSTLQRLRFRPGASRLRFYLFNITLGSEVFDEAGRAPLLRPDQILVTFV